MSALLLLLACVNADLSVNGSPAIATVGQARWNGSPQARTRLMVEEAGALRLVGDWQPALDEIVEVPVLGLAASTRYDLYVEFESGERSEPVEFNTGALPPSFPTWTTTGSPGWSGFSITSITGSAQWAIVLDELGRAVWFQEIEGPDRLVRVRARRDGLGVWAIPGPRVDSEADSELIGLNWRGEEIERHPIVDFSHDYVELPDGSVAFLNFDRRMYGEVEVLGNHIVEYDLETGTQTVVASTFDFWEPDLAGVEGEYAWTGGNALDYNEATEVYTAGFRQLGALVEVSRDTGEVLRQLGGPSSDYAFPTEADALRLQHQFQLEEDRALVFDNRSSAEFSRVIAYDLADGVATPTSTYESDPPVWVFALGDVDRASDGGVLIDWSAAGILEELDPEGESRWKLSAELGTAFGFLERGDRLGPYVRP